MKYVLIHATIPPNHSDCINFTADYRCHTGHRVVIDLLSKWLSNCGPIFFSNSMPIQNTGTSTDRVHVTLNMRAIAGFFLVRHMPHL